MSSELNCGHTVIFDPPPDRGDTVYCERCRNYQTVTGGNVRAKSGTPLLPAGHARRADVLTNLRDDVRESVLASLDKGWAADRALRHARECGVHVKTTTWYDAYAVLRELVDA